MVIDSEPNGIGMKQCVLGYYNNPDEEGPKYDIRKYDSRNSPGIMYKLGTFLSLKMKN